MTNRLFDYERKTGFYEGAWRTGNGMKKDKLKPSLSLLVKLGSIAVHAEEMLSPKGHFFDRKAIESLLSDAETQQWIKEMGAFLPQKR